MKIKHKVISTAVLALMVSATVGAQDGQGRVSPTADIDAPARPVMDVNIERDATQDASLQGGAGTIGEDSRVPIPDYTCANYPGSQACNTTPPVVQPPASSGWFLVNPKVSLTVYGHPAMPSSKAGMELTFRPPREAMANRHTSLRFTLRHDGRDYGMTAPGRTCAGFEVLQGTCSTSQAAWAGRAYRRGGATFKTYFIQTQAPPPSSTIRVFWAVMSSVCEGPHPAWAPGSLPSCTNIIFE